MSAKQISSEKVEISQSSAYHPTFSESDKKKYGKYICYIGEFILKDVVHREKIVTSRGQVEYLHICHSNPKQKETLFFHVQFTDGTGDDLELKEIEEGIREYKRKGDLTSSEKQVLLAVDKEMLLHDDRDMFIAMKSAVKLTIGNKRVELRPNKENQIAQKVEKPGLSNGAALKEDQSALKSKITEPPLLGDIRSDFDGSDLGDIMSDYDYSDLSYQESSSQRDDEFQETIDDSIQHDDDDVSEYDDEIQETIDDSIQHDDDDDSEYEASDGVDESFP